MNDKAFFILGMVITIVIVFIISISVYYIIIYNRRVAVEKELLFVNANKKLEELKQQHKDLKSPPTYQPLNSNLPIQHEVKNMEPKTAEIPTNKKEGLFPLSGYKKRWNPNRNLHREDEPVEQRGVVKTIPKPDINETSIDIKEGGEIEDTNEISNILNKKSLWLQNLPHLNIFVDNNSETSLNNLEDVIQYYSNQTNVSKDLIKYDKILDDLVEKNLSPEEEEKIIEEIIQAEKVIQEIDNENLQYKLQ